MTSLFGRDNLVKSSPHEMRLDTILKDTTTDFKPNAKRLQYLNIR